MKYKILILATVLLAGCSYNKSALPSILTSKETMWTIPKGVKFKAIQKPAYPDLTEFVVPDDDLKVLYGGNLLELEEEANQRVVRASRSAKARGTAMGAIGALLSVLAGLIGKKALTKKKEA